MPIDVQGLPSYWNEFGKTWVRRADGSNELQVRISGNGADNALSASLIHPVSATIAGSQSVMIVGQVGSALSASIIHPVSATIAGSQSVFIVGQAEKAVLSSSIAYPISGNLDTVTTVGRIVQDIRSTNLGIRPLTSASDTVNVPTVGTVGTVANLVGDVRATNFGTRPLRSDSDLVGAVQSGTWTIPSASVTIVGSIAISSVSLAYPVTATVDTINRVGQVVGDVRGTNFGIRPLTSASDTVNVPTVGTVGTVANLIADVKGTNFGIRPLTSASDSVTAVISSGSVTIADFVGVTGSFRNVNLSTKQQVNGGKTDVYYYHFYNPNTADGYIQLYDDTSANVTVGTTTPKETLGIPAGGLVDTAFVRPVGYPTALTIAATMTTGSASFPATGFVADVRYEA